MKVNLKPVPLHTHCSHCGAIVSKGSIVSLCKYCNDEENRRITNGREYGKNVCFPNKKLCAVKGLLEKEFDYKIKKITKFDDKLEITLGVE